MMKNMIVVYSKNSGIATVATFLGNQWWVTSKDERLEPLYSGEPYDQSDFRFLCDKNDLVLMKDLAGMMGCSLENAEDDIRETLKSRLKDLNAFGLKFQAVPQVLNLVVNLKQDVIGNNKGKYWVSCDDGDNDWMRYFYVSGIATAKEAWSCVRAYMDFFLKHGVKVQTRLTCSGEVLDELVGMTQGVKVEIMDNL